MAKYGKKSIKKSIRLRDVPLKMDLYLANLTKNTEKAYKVYIDRLKQKNAVDIAKTQRLLRQANDNVAATTKQRDKFINMHADHSAEYKKYHNGKIEEYASLLVGCEAPQQRFKDELAELKNKMPTR